MVRAFVRTFYDDLVTKNVEFVDGYLLPPSGPGLGTALRPEVLKRADVTVQTSIA
jgi:L-alanine-DL-glutamate epimerase-like enolase superfamily enzyme